MSLNRVFLIGHLGADPEIRYTQAQLAICSLRIATNERRQGDDGQWVDHTEWHRVTAFGKTGETCGQYLKKGRQVFVEGKIQTRKYQDQEGKDRYSTEIIASGVRFIGGKGDGTGSGIEVERTPSAPRAMSAGSPAPAPIGETISFDDDDIPF